jgi:segregation and condensation protein B
MMPPRVSRQEMSGPDDEDLPDIEAVETPQASNVTALPVAPQASGERREKLRILEALLFAASEPLDVATLGKPLASASVEDLVSLLGELQQMYATRGINLVKVAGKWAFRTAEDLSYLLERHAHEERKLSKAAMETMAIIAYHQPVTRAEMEEIRGVATSAGTLDVLMETGWVRPRGRRRAPGRPITYGTTPAFLEHFSLDQIKDLPGLAELKGAGLLDNALPPDFMVPEPTDVAALMPDELPLENVEEPELALVDEEREEDEDDVSKDG